MRIAREKGSASDIRWHRKKDGSELFANGVLSAVRNQSGELVGYTKIISDEAARKQLEDSLVQANTALEYFASVASHDLQEPLRTMSSFAQLLLRQQGERLDPSGKQYLEFINSAASKMSTLIQDLLTYARTGVGSEPRVTISLDQEVESATSQLSAAIKEAGARVTHEPLPAVTAEPSQITRVFLNLISNAIKYRDPQRAPEVHISAATDEGQWITICIADNGIGFEEKYARSIFEPFTRLNGHQNPGSGIGLAICRRIVERCGGRIWAVSKPGEGSTFCFTLPRAQDG